MAPLVSVIVPVYNREKTIEHCVESIVAQTYSNFEIIMIDDGSTDNSLAVCNALREKYGEERYTIRVIHQDNGGASAARNRGMEAAEGKYFVCVDSDDTVTETYLQDMVELQESNEDLGCVTCVLKSLNITGIEYVFSDKEPVSICDRKDYMELYEKNIAQSPCLRLYRTDIVRKNNIRMRKEISNGEDLIFNLEYFDALENTKIGVLNKANYIYNDGDEQSLNWRYRPDLVEEFEEIDKNIKKYLIKWDAFEGKSRQKYYYFVFGQYVRALDNTFSPCSPMSFIQKIQYNNKILKSSGFAEALENSTNCQSRLVRAAYKSGHYCLVVLAKQFARAKNLFRRIIGLKKHARRQKL